MAVVELDTETGKPEVIRIAGVDDSGRITNPLVAEGQVVGGVVQGLGEALLEVMLHDQDGQPVTGSFVSYSVPTAGDVEAELHFEFQESPSPLNPLGAKGVGESGAIATPAAVVNALVDALKDTGINHLDMPVAPETVWQLLQHGGG
jgi:carbon-monoxide dehydrogenase large subunit